MKVEMVMPQMGESITEATVSRWLKRPGERVEKDEIILEISTDKVDSEIPSPAAGVVAELRAAEGDVVPVKTVVAVIDTEGSAAAAAGDAPPGGSDGAPAGPEGGSRGERHGGPAAREGERPAAPTAAGRSVSPVVRSLAEKHGIGDDELRSLRGSGDAGRVTKQDFLDYVETRDAASGKGAVPAPAAPAGAPPPRPASGPSPAAVRPPPSAPAARGGGVPARPGEWGDDGTKVVPMDAMRQAIADHMVRSKATSPHVYSVQEVDVTAVSKWRARHKDAFKKAEGFSLSFTPFFLEAAVKALVRYPFVNASVQEKRIILKRHVNLGCAVALENAGLIVPVIKRAEEKNLVGLARSLNDLAGRARSKKLLPDDVSGGTFTVTNPGVFGTLIGNPIINQPQVAILCLGAIQKRPVVIDDMIAVREMCYITLSYDHRIVDGMMGGQFLAFVREYLEGWDVDRPLN